MKLTKIKGDPARAVGFVSHTDCRSEIGKTVALIDTIITACEFIKDREFDDPNVTEALLDLSSHSGFAIILDRIKQLKEGS